MNFQDAVTTCLKKYADFSGRAARSEYWWFILFYLLVHMGCSLLNHPLASIAALVLLLPTLAVLARRMHDIDKSAWWLLALLIPLIGQFIILIFAVLKGTEGPNRFGLPAAPPV